MNIEELFLQYLAPALLTGLAMLFGWALKQLGNWLKSLDQSNVLVTIGHATATAAHAAVLRVETEIKPTFEAAAKDGKFSPAEKEEMKKKAIEWAWGILGDFGIKRTASNESLVAGKIEAEVQSLKVAKAAAAPKQ